MEEQNRYPEINPDRLPRAQEVFADAGGSFVEVITIAADIKTGEKIVVYREMSLPFRVLAGPLPDFQEKYQGISDESRGRTPEAEKEKKPATVASKPQDSPADAKDRVTIGDVKRTYGPAPKESGEKEESAGEMPVLDPLVEEFLDAQSNEEKLNILSAIRPRVTNDMIDVMAMALGIEIEPGDAASRWMDLRDCLLTISRYEQSRSRYHD